MPAKHGFNKSGRHGLNSLIIAVEKGDRKRVEELLGDGANVDSKTETRTSLSRMMVDIPYAPGSTALHVACYLGMTDIARLLINEGASINIRNEDGQTPLDMALQGFSYFSEVLEKRKKSKLSLGFITGKVESRVGHYEEMIATLIELGGKTGVFALPEREFKKPEPEQQQEQAAPAAPARRLPPRI